MKKHLTAAILLLLSLSILPACSFGGTSTSTTPDDTHRLYENNEFSVQIPKDWETIEKDDFTSDVPDVTMVVFRNNVKNETFTGNVNIVRNQLQETIDSNEYAKMVYNRQKNGLYEFKEIKREEYKIQIGGSPITSTYLIFEAKKGTDQQTVRYMQTYAVKNNFAYIITGAVSPQENDVTIQTIESIIKSFQLK